MQKVRCKVRAIVPRECVVCNRKTLEVLNFAERSKKRAFQFALQIHFADGTVAEAQPNGVISDITGIENVKEHEHHSKG